MNNAFNENKTAIQIRNEDAHRNVIRWLNGFYNSRVINKEDLSNETRKKYQVLHRNCQLRLEHESFNEEIIMYNRRWYARVRRSFMLEDLKKHKEMLGITQSDIIEYYNKLYFGPYADVLLYENNEGRIEKKLRWLGYSLEDPMAHSCLHEILDLTTIHKRGTSRDFSETGCLWTDCEKYRRSSLYNSDWYLYNAEFNYVPLDQSDCRRRVDKLIAELEKMYEEKELFYNNNVGAYEPTIDAMQQLIDDFPVHSERERRMLKTWLTTWTGEVSFFLEKLRVK